MTTLIVHPAARPLVGSVPVPSDKSIGHRALLFGALCDGESRIAGFSHGGDNVSTANVLRAMGVRVDEPSPTNLRVHGTLAFSARTGQMATLIAATPVRRCAFSAASSRLNTSRATLVGDETLSRRPMMRVCGPLRARGAVIEGRPHPKRQSDIVAPLIVGPLLEGKCLAELDYESPIASAQVKSAILLSGLFANGATRFKEPTVSRDHTERMLRALGCPIRTVGSVVELDPAGWDRRLNRIRDRDPRRHLGGGVSVGRRADRRGVARDRARRRCQSDAHGSARDCAGYGCRPHHRAPG